MIQSWAIAIDLSATRAHEKAPAVTDRGFLSLPLETAIAGYKPSVLSLNAREARAL